MQGHGVVSGSAMRQEELKEMLWFQSPSPILRKEWVRHASVLNKPGSDSSIILWTDPKMVPSCLYLALEGFARGYIDCGVGMGSDRLNVCL